MPNNDLKKLCLQNDLHMAQAQLKHLGTDANFDTMRKLIDVSKLHSLGWTHHVEIENGVRKLFEWYRQSLI